VSGCLQEAARDSLTGMETPSEVQLAKRALRRTVLAFLSAMTPAERVRASERARGVLAAQSVWRNAKSVLFYAPMAEELDVWPLFDEALALGKTVGLPRYDPRRQAYIVCRVSDPRQDLAVGHYGIREPAPHCAEFLLNPLDLILVPGVAYDMQGRRLGRGKGYYDRLLAALSGLSCGVAFDGQIVSTIPVDPHDARVNCILTPAGWHTVCDRGSVLE